MSSSIQHVSDTAFLVAAARAEETESEDGFVRDPYARRLVGERNMAPARWLSFGIGLRSRFIDEILLSEVNGRAIDCVLSVGAGLDTRPWRMPLPSSLRWIEVDFAPILDYKHGILNDVAPRCQLERMTADVNDKTDRERVLDAALRAGNRVLLLTEGLLFYLPAETVRSLAREAAGCSRWILDISFHSSFQPPDCGEAMRQAHELRHETRLEGAEILETITASGWKAAESKTFMRDGVPFAAQRMARSGWSPDPNAPRPPADDPAGVWLFERAD